MSDEDDFMPSADEEDFDFGYDGDDVDEDDEFGSDAMDEDDNVENKYYNAKAFREDDPQKALTIFQSIYESEKTSEMALKAYKQSLKLMSKGHTSDRIVDTFGAFVDALLKSMASKQYKDKSYSNTVESLAQSPVACMEDLHTVALAKLAAVPDQERLFARTTYWFARFYVDKGLYEQALEVLKQVPVTIEPTAGEDSWRNSIFLELLSLRMEIALKTGDPIAESLYEKSRSVRSQLVHPRTLAVIRECGGVVSLHRKRWQEARENLLKSFKHYDEAGSSDRVRVLKYYILAEVLTQSGINPFNSQETLAYRDYADLQAVAQLVEAFLSLNYGAFSAVLDRHNTELNSDPLIAFLLPVLREILRFQGLIDLSKPYSQVSCKFLADTLDISPDALPEMIMQLILDGKLPTARLGDCNQTLYLDAPPFDGTRQSTADQHNRTSLISLPERFTRQENAVRRERNEQQILRPTGEPMAEKADIPTILNKIMISEAILHRRTYYA